jgi:uncharacterized protein
MQKNIFIIHGTEGHPEENWFPWLRGELEARGHRVFVPQFPSPPGIKPKLDEWLEVIKDYEKYINKDTIFIGHSLGAMLILHLLDKWPGKVRAGFLVATAPGYGFGELDFDWGKIKDKAEHFEVFQSDNDPHVPLVTGEELAKNLGVELTFIPNAGHFNEKAGYLKFPELFEKIGAVLK